jgi:hypothetical protein
MENELLLLQQKISSLEQRLTHGKISAYSQSKQDRSRLEINLDLYDQQTQREPVQRETTNREIIQREQVVNESRRSNSVVVKGEEHQRKSNLSESKTRNRSKKMAESRDGSQRQSKTVSLFKEGKSGKSYMHPTNSSSKKSKKSMSRQILRNKVTSLNLNKTNFDCKSLANDQNGLLIFMQRLYKYHRVIQRESKNNRVYQIVFYVFCPYILTMMIMVKMHLQKVDKSRYEESLNFRPKSAGKSVKSSKPDSMLLDLKNTELQEEKAKNAELKKHNELLKKRVYSKTEFETQYKTAKAESQEFAEKLKVSEKIRKQQNTLIKQLQSQISKLRNEKRPATASKIPKPKKITLENDENTDANLPASQDGLIMAPKYTAIGNVEVKQRSSGKPIDKKSKPKKKVKTKKEAKPIKKYMR